MDGTHGSSRHNIRIQVWVTLVALLLFTIKMLAYYLTNSVAILSDALESTVNVVAAFIGLYSLWLAAKPRDAEHPYGHGKVEFISAALEGSFIMLAGVYILVEAVRNLIDPGEIQRINTGLLLVVVAGLINFAVGFVAYRSGRRNHSLALEASGQHLMTDSYTTLALVLGLGLVWWTGEARIDALVALVLAGILLWTGYRIARRSVAGIMDEADEQLLRDMIAHLETKRRPAWIDLHNLRVIRYGSVLHVDCHLTVPWYYNVREAHREVELLDQCIMEYCGRQVELFVHTDACKEFSCPLCTVENCPERRFPFRHRLPWTYDNVRENSRHILPD